MPEQIIHIAVREKHRIKHLHILIRHQPTAHLTMLMYLKQKKKRKRQARQALRKKVLQAQSLKAL